MSLAIASIIWGGMYVASDALMRQIPPFMALEMREVISAIVLIAIAKRKNLLKVERADYLSFFGVGLIGFTVSIGFQFQGTYDAGAGLGSLITASSPILIAILGALIFKEKVPPLRWAAIAIAFLGVAIVLGSPTGGKQSSKGVILLLVAMVAWSIYTIWSRRLLDRYSAITVVAVACAVGAVTSSPLAIVAAIHSKSPLPTTLIGWGEVGYISIVGMVIAFFLWVSGFKHVDASRGAVMLLFQPLAGVILGSLILGEKISRGSLIGGVLVCIGVVGAVLATDRPRVEEDLVRGK
ncbi:MAG: EamA family transporter [Actinomycetota bacterium]|nr:EamA family transporter [Actinomycetota bacterium]